MAKRWLYILGVWILLIPYLGIPYAWRNILLHITGLVVLMVALATIDFPRRDKESSPTTQKRLSSVIKKKLLRMRPKRSTKTQSTKASTVPPETPTTTPRTLQPEGSSTKVRVAQPKQKSSTDWDTIKPDQPIQISPTDDMLNEDFLRRISDE